jgi:hypothetical protein
MDPTLLADPQQLRSAVDRLTGEGALKGVDETLLSFGVVFGEASSAGIARVKALPEVVAVDIDEKRHALLQGSFGRE